MSYFYELLDKVQELSDTVVREAECVNAALAGLDQRCGRIYIGEDFIASLDTRTLDYYGGFEYIDREHILTVGDLKIYSNESERVADALEAYHARQDS